MSPANHFYHLGRPIHDSAYFFGRQTEVQEALGLLRRDQSISIIGPRRIGKTSFLNNLASSEVLENQGSSRVQICFVYIDCTLCSALQVDMLYQHLLTELNEVLPDRFRNVMLDDVSSAHSSGALHLFRQAVQACFREGMQVVFLLDEFEALTANPNLDAGLFSALRGLASQYGLTFVTGSVAPLLNLTYANPSILNSPFFNIFAQLRLGLFRVSTARHMLTSLAERSEITLTEALFELLLDLAGPNPMLLQIAGYCAIQVLSSTTTPDGTEIYDTIRRQFVTRAQDHWRYAWNSLSADDQKCLALLPVTKGVDLDCLQRLETQCLVWYEARQDGETDVKPLSASFQDFVATQEIPGLMQVPPVKLEPTQRLIILRGEQVHLPPSDFDLLHCLLDRAGEVVPYQELYDAIWPDDDYREPDMERLKTVVKTLRRTFGDDKDRIQNVARVGYQFVSKR